MDLRIITNGIGLFPDGTKLYVAKTCSSQLSCFHLQAPGGIDRL
jgi:sugar lactone lactonase YvrE